MGRVKAVLIVVALLAVAGFVVVASQYTSDVQHQEMVQQCQAAAADPGVPGPETAGDANAVRSGVEQAQSDCQLIFGN